MSTNKPEDSHTKINTGGGSYIEGDVDANIFIGRDLVIYDGKKPISAATLLKACQAQVKGVLFDVRHKYDPKLYVNRAIERELIEFFNTRFEEPSPNCFLIVAPAGSGKTNLLCELARTQATQRPILLLMGGSTYISATTGLLGSIQSELETASAEVVFRSASDSLHTMHRLAEEMDRDALLILDAINEHDQPAQMRKALEDLLRKTRRQRIKLVITCRDYYWGLFKGQFWEGATVNDLPAENEEDEADNFSYFAAVEQAQALLLYLAHYRINGRPVGDAAEQCRHPLLLRFFCEAYRGQEIGEIDDIRLKELFDRYWGQKLASIAERMIRQGHERLQTGLVAEVADYLLNIAAHMLHQNVRAIPLAEITRATGRNERHDDPHSIYGRIRDEFIILEEKERGEGLHRIIQIAFVYEEFMEYVMARSLVRSWNKANLSEKDILAKVNALTGKYESFAQILGVMVYLGLMLKEQRNLALWSLLVNQGKHWQNVIFEAFRKLPETQLDAGVFDTLTELLVMDDENVQNQVLYTLNINRVGQAAPAYIAHMIGRLTTHRQESIARQAVLALGKSRAADVVLPLLVEAIHDPRKSVRRNAITALKRLGKLAMEPLVAALKDDERSVRQEAVEALGELMDVRAVGYLIVALKDSDQNVRRGAVRALGQIWELPDLTHLGSKDDQERLKGTEALGKLGDVRAVEPLIAALKDRDEHVRLGAAEALGKLGDVRAVEPLIAALKDRDEHVRRGAAEALGKLGDVRAVEPLIAALKDRDEHVRLEAAEALGKLGDVRAVEPLIAALKDRDRRVRLKAVEALGKLGDTAVEPLIAALKDRDETIRLGATGVLGQIWGLPNLIQLGSQDVNMRRRAAEALGKLGDTAVEPLIAALKDSDGRVQRQVIETLKSIGTPEALSTVREYKTHQKK